MSSERHCSQCADKPTDAESRSHVADRFSARVEYLERRNDDQDVQTAADERLREDQRDDQTNPRHARDRAEPGRDQLPGTLARRRQTDPVLDPDSDEKDRRYEESSGTRGEHDPRIRNRYEQACEQRTNERSEALDRRRSAICRNEFLGSARERWQQRLQGGPDECDREPEQSSECEHEGFGVRVEGDGRRAERDESDERQR